MPSWGSEWRWRGSAAELKRRRIRDSLGSASASRDRTAFRSPGVMVRAIVLGAGAAGERHARALRALADRCLVAGVYDPDPEAAKRLAMTLGIPWLEELEPAFQEAHVAVVGGLVEH